MSHGLIRLKKVKAAPKRNLSIIKSSVYKKQLSVRFEDQKPIDTIKNLSQDIDEISQVIDTYFPIKSSNTDLTPVLLPSLKNSSFQSSDLSSPTLSSSLDSNQYFFNRLQLQNPLEKILSQEKHAEKILSQQKHAEKILNSKIDDESVKNASKSCEGQEGIRKYRNMAPVEAYGYDFRVVKKGWGVKIGGASVGFKSGNEDFVTPKVVKQTKPLKRAQKTVRRGGKDIIIAT